MSMLLKSFKGDETDCYLRGDGPVVETRAPQKDDWWYVDAEALKTSESTKSSLPEELPFSTQLANAEKLIRPVRKNSVGLKLTGDRKVLMQQWECIVLQRDYDVVFCELHDLTVESNPTEYADVLLTEFNDYDLPLLGAGAVFYWSVGHLRRHTGQVKRFSEIRVRRMPKISKSRQGEIARKVEKLSGLLLSK